jgi:hypothetical protein
MTVSLLDLARARLPTQFLTLERQKARFDRQTIRM